MLNSIRPVASRKHRVCRLRRFEASKKICVARQPAHRGFRYAMLAISWGVAGPRPSETLSRRTLAPNTAGERQIRPAPFASTCCSLRDATADGIEIQHRNSLGLGRLNSTQQENCRKTTCQHYTTMLGPPPSAHPQLSDRCENLLTCASYVGTAARKPLRRIFIMPL